jgi:putative transposase
MRRSQFTDQEIIHLICEADAGVPVAEICRTSRVSLRTFYRWRQRFGGLTPQAVLEMKELQAENRRLRALVGSLTARLRGAEREGVETRPPSAQERRELGVAAARSASPSVREGVALGRFAGVRINACMGAPAS